MPATLTLDTVLDSQQLKAYHIVVEAKGGLVWMAVGTGKTRVGILAALQLRDRKSAIPVVLRREAFYDFQQEIAALQLDVDIIEMEQLPLNYVFSGKPTFVLISNGMLLNTATESVVRRLWEDEELGAIIIDEGYLYKNPKAKTHMFLRTWTAACPTILLSGSIMTARDLVDIFGQNAVIGKMKALAQSLTAFRTEFQRGINERGIYKWYPKSGSYQKILDKIGGHTHIFIPRKLKDRTVKEQIIKVPPTKQQLAYFKELKEYAGIEGRYELSNMANVLQKAQQISDGWLSGEKGMDVVEIKSNKVERARMFAEEVISSGKKLVIWCAFRYDIDRLLPDMTGICSVATFRGGEEFDVEHWKKPDTMICLATMASGSSVNHFAQCPYGLYFSQDNKWLNLQQSQGRHTRKSSEHPETFFTFLHTEKSLDSSNYYIVRTSMSQERGMINAHEVRQWIESK